MEALAQKVVDLQHRLSAASTAELPSTVHNFADIVGRAPPCAALELARRCPDQFARPHLRETGTGKELVAPASITSVPAATVPSLPRTAPPCPDRCWKGFCSAPSRAASPAPPTGPA